MRLKSNKVTKSNKSNIVSYRCTCILYLYIIICVVIYITYILDHHIISVEFSL